MFNFSALGGCVDRRVLVDWWVGGWVDGWMGGLTDEWVNGWVG
jgi:hypothetical protein